MSARRRSVLSPPLLAKLTAFGPRLGQSDCELEDVLADLAALPPDLIVQANYEIAVSCQLYRAARDARSDHELLQRNAAYAWLFLFHADGRIREAALDTIQDPPPSPFLFAALAWRLNDWVVPVRQAAQRCAERMIARTAPEVAAGVAVYLLDRHLVWKRWNEEAKVLDPMFERQEVMAGISAHLAQQAAGPMPSHLRHILRYPGFDAHLTELAATAVQPVVRALAYRCLISGKTSWQAPDQRSKMDKILGIKARTPRRETRTIGSSRAIADVIVDAVHDPSTLVRKTVADALIVARPRLREQETLIVEVIGLLANDPSAMVRSRADFLQRHPPEA